MLQNSARVDFYVLAAADDAARMRFACRLAEKACHLKHRIHLHTDSAGDASALDELLWTFRQGSFVPHEIVVLGLPARSPVTIGHGGNPPPPGDLLINLAGAVPDFAGQFTRVAEIVDGSEQGRRLGRERFRSYRERGQEPATHNIGSNP